METGRYDRKNSSKSPVKEEQKAISDAIEYGIDVSLLEVNLSLTPQVRLERHESALELFNDLRRAGEQLYKA